MKIIDKLSTYASLIGVIGAIGGGFYAWGEFNTRLSAIENKDFTKTAAEVFWASKYRKTTFSDELVKRINRGQLGRAPLIVFGIPPISGT